MRFLKPTVNAMVKRSKTNASPAANAKRSKRKSLKETGVICQEKHCDLSPKIGNGWCTNYPGSSCSLTNPPLKEAGAWNFKCVSWNVAGIRACIKNGLMDYFREENPDIFALQEVKCQLKDLPSVAKISGYENHWYPGEKPGHSGTGFYSKRTPLSITYGFGKKEHDNEGRLITVEFEEFFFLTTYVPNSGRGLVRLAYRTDSWDKLLRDYVKELDSKKPVILCGDLNVAHKEIDLTNPKTNRKSAGFTDEERLSFSQLLQEADLVDTYRHFYPNRDGAYTFWSNMRNSRAKNIGWRLDYFLVSRRFLPHVVDQEIRCAVPGSDHCPIVIYLKL